MRKSGDGLAEIDLDASVAAIDGKAVPTVATRPVSAGPIEIDAGLFRSVAERAGHPMFIAMRRSGMEWAATLFSSAKGVDEANRLGKLPL